MKIYVDSLVMIVRQDCSRAAGLGMYLSDCDKIGYLMEISLKNARGN